MCRFFRHFRTVRDSSLRVPDVNLLRFGLPFFQWPRGIDPETERRPEAAQRPSSPGWVNRRRHSLNLLAAILSGVLWFAAPAKAQEPLSSIRYDGTVDGNGLPDQLSAPGASTFGYPKGLALDLSGTLYIADTGNNRILKVVAGATTATVFTISGLSSPSTLSSPNQLTVDSAGNLYIADTGNSRIVEVSPSGSASVLSTGSYTLSGPLGIAVDTSGDVFISDTGNNRVIELPSGGSATVLATTGIALTGLTAPKGLATDTYNNLYIVDSGNNRVIKVDTSLHGTLVPVSDSSNGNSGLTGPISVAVGANGIIYITDPGGFRVAVSDPQGNTCDLFGDDFLGIWGTTFGSGVNAIATDSRGTIYVTDTAAYNTVWVHHQFSADFGHVTLGSSGTALTLNFTLSPGALGGEPITTVDGVAIYTAGAQNLDFAISQNGDGCTGRNGNDNVTCTVSVKFTPRAAGLRRGALVVSYDSDCFGSGTFTVPLFGVGDGPVAALSPGAASQLSTGTLTFPQAFVPFQTAYDGAGNIYATDSANNRVLKIPAGGGNATVVSIPALSPSPAGLSGPTGIAIDGAGNLYISDSGNNRIVEVTASGASNVVTLNDPGISFNNPQSLFMDGSGNLFVNDVGNNRIVELTPAYGDTNDNTLDNAGPFVLSTGNLFPGTGGSSPYNVSTSSVVDNSGALYIADDANSRLIKVDRFGKASPVDFSSLSQALITPHSLALDPMGNLYVMDNGGGAGKERIIQQFTTGVNSTMVFSGTSFGSVSNQIAVNNYGNVLVADLPQNGGRLVQINVGESAMSFPGTPMDSASSALTTKVTNLGDLPLVFSANPAYAANFSQNASDENPCTSDTSLTVGTRCDVSVRFAPYTTGSLSGNITITDNTQKHCRFDADHHSQLDGYSRTRHLNDFSTGL
jgi:sugar lactone lactonase YvrE